MRGVIEYLSGGHQYMFYLAGFTSGEASGSVILRGVLRVLNMRAPVRDLSNRVYQGRSSAPV
jgi:hypothetical protein